MEDGVDNDNERVLVAAQISAGIPSEVGLDAPSEPAGNATACVGDQTTALTLPETSSSVHRLQATRSGCSVSQVAVWQTEQCTMASYRYDAECCVRHQRQVPLDATYEHGNADGDGGNGDGDHGDTP